MNENVSSLWLPLLSLSQLSLNCPHIETNTDSANVLSSLLFYLWMHSTTHSVICSHNFTQPCVLVTVQQYGCWFLGWLLQNWLSENCLNWVACKWYSGGRSVCWRGSSCGSGQRKDMTCTWWNVFRLNRGDFSLSSCLYSLMYGCITKFKFIKCSICVNHVMFRFL